ncbi:MAG: kelch repeat-containing protein [Polyangiales bacterium]
MPAVAAHVGIGRALAVRPEGFVAEAGVVLPRTSTAPVHLASAERTDVWIDVAPTDLRAVEGRAVEGAVSYPSVAPSTDLVWADDRTRVEEWRLLRDASAKSEAHYRIHGGPGVASVRTRVGRVEILDETGRVHLTTDDLVAHDQTGEKRPLSIEVAKVEGDWTIALRLDTRGLQYPVAIDPAWVSSALMLTGRGAHASLALNDGRVMVLGGYAGGGAAETGSSEIYDPATNVFTSAGAGGQGEHQNVTIDSAGRVFRSGGTTKLGPTGTADIWVPGSGWMGTLPQSKHRYYQGAAAAISGNRFMTIGGSSAASATGGDVEIYSIATNTWADAAPLGAARTGHTATTLADGSVLVAGGDNGGGTVYSSALRYNVATNTWAATGALKHARSGHSAILLTSGKVLMVGNAGTFAEVYDPATGTFTDVAPMMVARTNAATTLMKDGRVMAAGGGSLSSEIYDPVKNTWTTAGTMLGTRDGAGASILPSGRVIVSGDYSSATNTTETWGNVDGSACTAGYECVSANCVDGVCCSTASCSVGAKCNQPGKLGVCSKPLGVTCGAAGECASGKCVDGVCCNSACTQQCSACNVAGKLGTCSPVVGVPTGGRAACTGAGLGTTCGSRCDGYDGAKCNFPTATTACGADTCNPATGTESHVGSCNGAGVCSSTTDSCGAYKCGATACLTSCGTSDDCVSGFYCKTGVCSPLEDLGKPCKTGKDCGKGFCADGFCCEKDSCGVDASCGLTGHEGLCATKQGRACLADGECITGHCTDGVCCDSKCDGQCEACDVEGKVGLCSPVNGKPHGMRTACGGTDACGATQCAGAKDRTTCAGFVAGTDVECKPASCEGSSFTPPSSCDGMGTCATPKASTCTPYKCNTDGCLHTCKTDSECESGFACLGDRCEPRASSCSDDQLTSIGRDGVSTDCTPYRCLDSGECGKSCKSSSDCAPSNACDTATNTCTPSVPAEGDTGGCSVGHSRSSNYAWLVFGIAMFLVSRRRKVLSLAAGLGVATALGCSREAPKPSVDTMRAVRDVPLFAERLERAVPLVQENDAVVARDLPLAATISLAAPKVRLEAGGSWIELRGEEGGTASLSGRSVVRREVALDTDVVETVDANGYETLRTLKSPRAKSTSVLKIAHAPGISLRLREGRIEAIEQGVVRIGSAPIYAIDARGVRRSGFVRELGEDTFELGVDTAGLAYPVVIDPAWSVITSLAKERVNARAAKLLDGRLLVAAGSGEKSSEIYDPVTNAWSTTAGSLTGVYSDFEEAPWSLAMLPTGKALAVYKSAERFDPKTGTWSAAGQPAAGAARYQAIALPGGKVLSVCGAAGASIYDEATNAWTATTSPLVAHAVCTAVALADGRVLVAGGSTNAAEIFDPTTSTWKATGNMTVSADYRAAVLLTSGKVLFAGPGTAAEVFDPAGSGTFKAVAASSVSRDRASATLLSSGRVLVTGGRDGTPANFVATAVAELFDPATNTWSTGGTMGSGRAYHATVRLDSGRVLVAAGATKASGVYGIFPTAAAELYGGIIGVACTAGWECASGNCVDGVCCTTASCPFAAVCNTALKNGTCAKNNGLACSADGECATGQCADGYCCDKACDGTCEACDLPAKVGICSPVLGPPRGTRGACPGSTDPYCGVRCDGMDRTACHAPGAAASCGVNGCTGGIETHASTCDASGKCGDVAKSCLGFACGATACKTSCTLATDCVAGYTCKSGACVPVDGLGTTCKTSSECSSGFCTDGVCCGVALCPLGSSCATDGSKGVCRKERGTACTSDPECGSNHCVDGVCCDSACDGQCEACDVDGKLGSCIGVAGKPHGSRPACDDGGGDACKAKVCDGAKDPTTCSAYASGSKTECAAASCTGTTFVGVSTCSGAGACAAPAPQECAPYRCDDAGCRTSCAKPEHCAEGNICVKGTCVPLVATCSDDRLSSTAKDGTTSDCRPYRCTTTGACGTQCASSSDCSPDALCDTTAKVCNTVATGDSGGGCVYGTGRATRSFAALFLAVLAFRAVRGGRARRGV